MSTLQKWELIAEKDISPSPHFPLFQQIVRLPNGKVIDDYYVSKLGDVAMIVAITAAKKIIFVKQYKQGTQQFTIELPAGRIKPGLTKLEGAQTELLEETGYTAENYQEFGGVCPLPTKDPSIMYGFLATDLTDTNEQHLDETEAGMEVLFLSAAEVEAKIITGEIKGSDTIAILHLALLKFPELF